MQLYIAKQLQAQQPKLHERNQTWGQILAVRAKSRIRKVFHNQR